MIISILIKIFENVDFGPNFRVNFSENLDFGKKKKNEILIPLKVFEKF